MANRALFSSAKSRLPRADVLNEAGGRAYGLEPRHALAQLAATGCLHRVYYASAQSQLTAGNPFSTVRNSVGKFFSLQQQYIGPQPAPGSPAPPFLPCPYQSRQQIGHFLYVLDRRDSSILVVNSNRFQILDRIKTPDPLVPETRE